MSFVAILQGGYNQSYEEIKPIILIVNIGYIVDDIYFTKIYI